MPAVDGASITQLQKNLFNDVAGGNTSCAFVFVNARGNMVVSNYRGEP